MYSILYGLGVGIKQLVEAEYGSRAWEDGVFETTINSISLVGGVALVMLQTTGPAGPILAVVLVTADGLYYGIQKVKEYDNYKLTDQEKARLFWHGVLRLTDPQELEYLRDRQDMVDQLAHQNWARLQQLPIHIVGIGAGLGEYELNERWYYQEVNTTRLRRTPVDRIKPGLSFMNLDRPSLDFKNSLSRILPKNPDPHARFICLPRNRGEPIEMERDFWYPGIAVYGIYQSSTTVKHECQNAFALADIRRQPDKLKEAMIWLDLGLVLRGKVTGFPGCGAVFEVHGSLSDLELRGSCWAHQ